jgi:hypothetical protein
MWHSVAAPSGCRIWIGTAGSPGYANREYGRITVEGKTAYAHRVSYEEQVGPIPAGMQIDHLCRRPRCINPLHLQPVTPQVNMLRGTSPAARASRRTQCTRGHSYAEHSRVFGGRRYCVTCQRNWKRDNPDRVREYAAKRAAA